MKDRLHNAFKETPERFTYAIENALSEAKLSKHKKRLSTPLRVVIAVVLIFAILPSAVFGAVKIYGAIAHNVGNYGVAFDISINEDAPQYVKMNIDVPDGFKEMPNTEGMKYQRDNDEFGFTIFPMKFYESVDHTVLEKDVKEYNKMTIASHPSYELIGTDDYQGPTRYFVWYEEANVLMLIYRGETITDGELETFVDCISFVEGSEADHDTLFEPEKDVEETTEDTDIYEYEQVYIEKPKDTQIVFAGFNEETGESELEVKSKITDIRITDNINGLDKNDINDMYELSEVADSSGKLLPKTVEVCQIGDGINTESKILSSESKEQKLVLVDVEFTNTTNSEVSVYVPHRLETLVKDENENYNSATIIDVDNDIYVDEYCDTELFYMSYHGENKKDLYLPTLQPNETVTITIGFRCIEEQLSNAYIILSATTDGIISPEYSGDNFNTYYILKVQ